MIRLRNKQPLVLVVATTAVALLSCTRYSDSLDASFRKAACGGDIATIKKLFMLGPNVNATDVDGYSALMIVEACTTHTSPSRAELVELLIAKGAAVNLQARNGRTALMFAAENGDAQAVKALLRNGASVNTADNEGETALLKAVFFACDEETVKALLSAGADLNVKDHKGRTAFSNACLKGKLGLREITGADKGR